MKIPKIIMQKNSRSMERRKWVLFSCVSFIVLMSGIILANNFHQNNNFKPITNDGEKWALGYMEGGPYIHYTLYLRAIITKFIELGWMEDLSVPTFADNENSWLIWDYLKK